MRGFRGIVGACIAAAITTLGAVAARAQFESGSDESYGPLTIAPSLGTITIDPIPADGIFNCTTITIGNGTIVKFARNTNNTPIYLLATGDVVIDGVIDVSGANATSSVGAASGPGGFDGGSPGSVGIPPGAGFGPGAGLPGNSNNNDAGAAGGASYGTVPSVAPNAQDGSVYGSPLLIPLVGGSGGGGTDGTMGGSVGGGGGGGGAILIASTTKISFVSGAVYSYGGSGAGGGGGGSGGAIRLVAPVIDGTAGIEVTGNFFGQAGGSGRIRVDTLDRSKLGGIAFQPTSNAASVGSFMVVFPQTIPRLDITSAAGTAISVGSGPVFISLPSGTNPNQNVVVRAADFAGATDIALMMTPENGTPTKYTATIDMNTNPDTVTIPVILPINTGVYFNVWTE